MDEYIKAWCALKVLSKVYGFGDPDGFVFNMSVGYDLEGIKGEKVNTYIDGMMDAETHRHFRRVQRGPEGAVPPGDRLHRRHLPPGVPQRHRLHPPRLSPGRDRAHCQRI